MEKTVIMSPDLSGRNNPLARNALRRRCLQREPLER